MAPTPWLISLPFPLAADVGCSPSAIWRCCYRSRCGARRHCTRFQRKQKANRQPCLKAGSSLAERGWTPFRLGCRYAFSRLREQAKLEWKEVHQSHSTLADHGRLSDLDDLSPAGICFHAVLCRRRQYIVGVAEAERRGVVNSESFGLGFCHLSTSRTPSASPPVHGALAAAGAAASLVRRQSYSRRT